jgi:hypothetical protein
VPAYAQNITYFVSEDGSGYHAIADVTDVDRFDFVQSGMLGERVPFPVTNISLTQNGINSSYTEEREGIRFSKGNYTVEYDGKVSGNSFQVQYSDFGRATVILPEKYRVNNPLLTSIQPGGANISESENKTVIEWDKARYIDIRFYDANQESLLSIFGQFWFIIAILLLIPFLFNQKRQI